MDSWLIIWIVLAVAFAVTELATMAFVALYFALGAVVAAVVAGMGGNVTWQILAFVVSGVLLLALTRPLLKSRLEGETLLTNVHSVVGKGGYVTIPINNAANTGQIRIGSEFWTARLDAASTVTSLDVETPVTVLRVEGVTAWVTPQGA